MAFKSLISFLKPILSQLFLNKLEIFSFRLGPLIVNSLLIFLIYNFILKKLRKPVWAITTLILLSFEPFIVRFSRFTQIDAFLAFTMSLAVVYFVSHLSWGNKHDLILSAIFFALALLAKTPSLFFIPYIFLIIFLFKFRQKAYFFKKSFYLIFLTLVISFLAWPVLWSDPIYALENIFLGTKTLFLMPHSVIPSQKITVPNDYLFYLKTLIYFISPVYTALFILSLLLTARLCLEKNFKKLLFPFALQVFILGFTVFISLGAKKGERYLLPVLVMMAIISGFSLQEIYTNFYQKIKSKIVKIIIRAIALTTLLIYLTIPIRLFPYYFTYHNPWTPEEMFPRLGLGEGLELAADYLNSKENPEEIVAASWYDSSFVMYFKGKTREVLDLVIKKDIKDVQYAVVYRNMFGRPKESDATKVLALFEDKAPEKTIYINDLPYVWVYKLKEGK